MFKARRRDVKRKPMAKKSTDDESEDSDASVGTAPTAPQRPALGPAADAAKAAAAPATAGAAAEVRPKKMRKKAKVKQDKGPKPVLSFGHEDEEDDRSRGEGDSVFRVKKSKASKAMARAAKDKTDLPLAPQNAVPKGSWHTATAGMYTAEGLAQLRSSQAFTPKPSAARRERRRRGDAGAPGGERVFAGDEAEMVHEAGQKGNLNEEGLDEEQLSRMKSQRNAQRAAREAREKTSDASGEDYIPLDGKVPVPGAGKRVVHSLAGDGSLSHLDGNEEEGRQPDEEQQRWEDEQIRRGATRPAAHPGSSRSPPSSSASWGGAVEGFASSALSANGGGVLESGWGEPPSERPRFLGVDEVQKSLRAASTALRETHERNERQLQVLASELATHAEAEKEVARQQKEAADRFDFFQRTRNALSDLCGMLREKEGMLSEVESAKRVLHSRRRERVLRVRIEDQEDEILDARDAGANITGLGSYRPSAGGPLSRAPPIGGGAGSNGFGRVQGEDDRIRRRADRRKRRRRFARGEGEGWVQSNAFPWGAKEREEIWQAFASGGEESEGEGEAAETKVRKVMEAAEMVLEDVDDNVKSLSAIKALFEDWKRHHREQYAQAYCTLTLPDLLAPFVRLELLRWDPLSGKVDGIDNTSGTGRASPAEGMRSKGDATLAAAAAGGGDETDEGEDDLEGVFERFEWYRRFFDFSEDIPPPDNAGYSAEEDPDHNLVPQLVDKIAVPLVAERLASAYDAMSRMQTASLTAAVSELLMYDPPEDSLNKLLGAALQTLKVAIGNLCAPVVGPSSTPEGCAAAIAVVRIQACRGLKLLRNCLAWRDLLSPETLLPLTLGDLVAKKLVPAMHGLAGRSIEGSGAGGNGTAEAVALCERTVELLPLDWMDRPDASAALASLKVLARSFGDDLKAGSGSKRDRGAIERVVRLHVALGDDVAARDLAQRHGLKIS